MADTDRLYGENLRLSQTEYERRHVYLYCRPRYLGLVLGNACNIECAHCYQARNGDALLRPAEIGGELRRELMGFYPYLSTLRVQGGEVFAIRGFRELTGDVAESVGRPILSVSTNATLIDEGWAERIVRTPFASVTVSIDGGSRATYNRLRRGADLDRVLANIDRVQRWKAALGSDRPDLDSFFVIMRSNFREIPQYLELMRQRGMSGVALQTMQLNAVNTARTPTLEADEAIAERGEVEELHAMLRETLPRYRKEFRALRVSGLRTLFENHGLSATFLEEGENGLYPASDGLSADGFDLCPNPWTTLFLAENGDAHLCFLSQPVGNLYAEPLAALWNSPAAMTKRSRMISGRYVASGCSRQYCGWRDGKPSHPPEADASGAESGEAARGRPWPEIETPSTLALVRRLMAEEGRKRREIEAYRESLETLLDGAQKHIDHLEAKAAKAVADFRDFEAEFRKYRASWLVRAAHRAVKFLI